MLKYCYKNLEFYHYLFLLRQSIIQIIKIFKEHKADE